MSVCHVQRVAILYVNLSLSRVSLTLGIFNLDSGTLQTVAYLAHQPLFLGGLKNMIVLVIRTDGSHFLIIILPKLVVCLVKNKKFEFGCDRRSKSHFLESIDLLF